MNSAPEDQRRRERGHGRQTPREPISITDRRRVDPVTGRVREHAAPSRTAAASRGAASSSQPRGGTSPAPPRTAAPGGASGAGASPESAQVDADRVAELTADLQRLQAQYTNYRRRVDRDRAAAAENAKAAVAEKFLGVLDDLDWAREHGDTHREPLHGLDRKIRVILARIGVAAFGEPGDRFDPTLHEAASHEGSGTDLVVGTVLRRGYTFGERKVLRTAVVTVIDREQYDDYPADPPPPADADADAGDAEVNRPGDHTPAARGTALAETATGDRPAGADPPATTTRGTATGSAGPPGTSGDRNPHR